ncbi:MAG: hypothetical protein Q9163_005822 [Psora crenata]
MASSPRHPRNRQERRAQLQAQVRTRKPIPSNNGDGDGDGNGSELPLSQPQRPPRTSKTLLEIASERQQVLLDPSSRPEKEGEGEDNNGNHPWLEILLYSVTLTVLHFTFTVLVQHQYGNAAPHIPTILWTSTIASPTPLTLLVLVAVLHPRAGHPATQALFAVMSVVAGTWLVRTSNRDEYLAAMQKAPPLGTLWVWSTVEMRWEMALASLVGVGGWGWWRGYGMF